MGLLNQISDYIGVFNDENKKYNRDNSLFAKFFNKDKSITDSISNPFSKERNFVKFIKKYANYWGQLATKLFDNEAYEFVFGGVLNLDGDDDRVAGCGITQKRIIVTTTQGTVSYPYDKTKSVSGSKGLVGAAVNIEIPRSKVKISVDKPYLDNIIKAIDAAIKKYHVA